MRIRGYKPLENEDDIAEFFELSEINLSASPSELRKIADFLLEAADSMERMDSAYGHEHLSDKHSEFESSPHLVVIKESYEQ